MSTHPIVDPELLDLLREISADPESRLMRIATHGADTRIGLRQRTLSAREPFLTRAERHLVREHREQVARLLFEAAKRALLRAPRPETMVYHGPHSRWGRMLEQEELDRERATVLRQELSDEEAETRIAGLDGSLREREGDRYGVSFAVASMRLVPRDSARNLLAVAYFALGRKRDGILLSDEILSCRPTAWYRSVALQSKAFRLDDPTESRRLYGESARAEPTRPEPWVGMLHASMCLVDRAGVLRAARELAELPSESSAACIDEYLTMWGNRSASGAWSPPEEAAALARGLADQLPTPATRATAAFLGHSDRRTK